MFEMGVLPSAWRAESPADREYLLGVRRNMRAEESVEYEESKDAGKPAPPLPPEPEA
jgi:hypothetical protein